MVGRCKIKRLFRKLLLIEEPNVKATMKRVFNILWEGKSGNVNKKNLSALMVASHYQK